MSARQPRELRDRLSGLVPSLRRAEPPAPTKPPKKGDKSAREEAEREALKRARRLERARLQIGRLDYAGGDIFLKLSSMSALVRLNSCAKEPWTVEWIESRLKPGDTLYDIGANVGAYSLIAAHVSGGRASVFAFEPGYATFAELCENVVLNQAGASVRPLPLALSAQTELSTIAYRDLAPGRALHSVGGNEAAGDPFVPVYTQPLLVYRLDDLVRQFELPPPSHVKLDVDGLETAVLEGATETLGHPGLRSLMVELQDDQADEIVSLLRTKGFELRERYRADQESAPDHSYGLFARQ